MRNPGGFSQIFAEKGCDTGYDEYGREVPAECDTFRCGHCQKVVFVPPKQAASDMGGLCYGCMRLICPHCVTTGKCDPLEEKIERVEKTQDFRRWFSDAAA